MEIERVRLVRGTALTMQNKEVMETMMIIALWEGSIPAKSPNFETTSPAKAPRARVGIINPPRGHGIANEQIHQKPDHQEDECQIPRNVRGQSVVSQRKPASGQKGIAEHDSNRDKIKEDEAVFDKEVRVMGIEENLDSLQPENNGFAKKEVEGDDDGKKPGKTLVEHRCHTHAYRGRRINKISHRVAASHHQNALPKILPLKHVEAFLEGIKNPA